MLRQSVLAVLQKFAAGIRAFVRGGVQFLMAAVVTHRKGAGEPADAWDYPEERLSSAGGFAVRPYPSCYAIREGLENDSGVWRSSNKALGRETRCDGDFPGQRPTTMVTTNVRVNCGCWF